MIRIKTGPGEIFRQTKKELPNVQLLLLFYRMPRLALPYLPSRSISFSTVRARNA